MMTGNILCNLIGMMSGNKIHPTSMNIKFVPQTLKHLNQQKIFENEAFGRWIRIQNIIDSSEKASALLEYGKWYDTEYKKIIIELLDDENKS